MDTVPTTINDWYTQAIHFKTQWDRADAIASKKPYNPYPVQRNHANHQTPKVDPYTMDVDSIHIDVKNEAIAWLTTTSVTKNLPLGDYISQFKNHVALSEITHEDTLINFFSRGIPAPLMKRIYGMDTVPTTISDWYTRAIHFKT